MFDKEFIRAAVESMPKEEFVAKFRAALDKSHIHYEEGHGKIVWSELTPPCIDPPCIEEEDNFQSDFYISMTISNCNWSKPHRAYVQYYCDAESNKDFEHHVSTQYVRDKVPVGAAS